MRPDRGLRVLSCCWASKRAGDARQAGRLQPRRWRHGQRSQGAPSHRNGGLRGRARRRRRRTTVGRCGACLAASPPNGHAPGRCARRGRRDGVLASLGAAPKRSAGGHGRGIGFPLINQHAAAVRGRLAGRVRRHHVAVACARSDCWEKADGVPVGAHGGDRRGVAPRV